MGYFALRCSLSDDDRLSLDWAEGLVCMSACFLVFAVIGAWPIGLLCLPFSLCGAAVIRAVSRQSYELELDDALFDYSADEDGKIVLGDQPPVKQREIEDA